jgi:iron only hydrogenase large subunit-like protein
MPATKYIVTIPERCKMCYTCVRECPAKAIRIANGQAEVIAERCIACGNCVLACSQHAKTVIDSISDVDRLIAGDRKVVAIIAPSFPADFTDITYQRLVGIVKELGFSSVYEVAFGADLVAAYYSRLLIEKPHSQHIATSCPAVVSFVEKYFPDLVNKLAPIISPMIAMARVVRRLHDEDIAVVFIGPCIAKKCEANDDNLEGDIDAVLTFVELRTMINRASLLDKDVSEIDFDPPHPNLGALFPITGGLLQAAHITEDLLTGEVVATHGRTSFIEAIREFESGALDTNLLEILCCDGCIMGAGMSSSKPRFARRTDIGRYVRRRTRFNSEQTWRNNIARFFNINMYRTYTAKDQTSTQPSEEDLTKILHRMGKNSPEDELNCGACGYDTCRKHAVAIYKGLAESEMCLPYTIDQLKNNVKQLADTNVELGVVQNALIQSEKLASMGQLAAGIAHEINNPLGVVLMYAHLLLEEHTEDKDLQNDLSMIVEHADRSKGIISGLLNFARQNKVNYEKVNINELVDKSLKTITFPENIHVTVSELNSNPFVEVDHDQMMQVFTNLYSNSIGAMETGGNLSVTFSETEENISVSVTDTGIGIPADKISKIYEPFYTTKALGKGTGLGLAVSYGIVKMHRGTIKVSSNANPDSGPTGTTFTITLPRNAE